MQPPGLATHSDPLDATPSGHRRPAWLEWELALVVLLVVGVYFTRLNYLTIRGEESRWARVAQEMLDSGDWIVPRQQGEPFPDRPPLNSWAMIGASYLTGGLNLTAVRLPSVLATLAIAVLLYVYARNYLSRLGALTAALAYPTTPQVLHLGRVAESDSLLTLAVTAALLGWHDAYARRRDPARAWLIGYGFAALAGLAKGPQGPVYFIAICVLYLAWKRDWAFLCNRWHAVGVGLFLAIVAAWQLPFYWELDATRVRAIWAEGGDLNERFDYSRFGRVLAHWLTYPLEVFSCLLPWSFLLPVLATRWFRRNVGPMAPLVSFALVAWAVALPTCWLPAVSRSRYMMSLYPCAALLVGAVVDRCWASCERDWWARSWDRYVTVATALVGVAGAAIAVGQWSGLMGRFGLSGAISNLFAGAYLACAVMVMLILAWSRKQRHMLPAEASVAAMAAIVGLTYTGVVVGAQACTSNDPSAEIVAIREMIPPGERLVSFDKVHHLFAYYYDAPIELQRVGKSRVATEMPGEYFCFAVDPQGKPLKIPFAWRTVAEISCERTRSEHPKTKVVVGQRLDYTPTPMRDEMVQTVGHLENDDGTDLVPASAIFEELPE